MPLFLAHAELAGLAREKAASAVDRIRGLPVIGAERTAALLRDAGFIDVTPVYQGLWYRAWLCRAA